MFSPLEIQLHLTSWSWTTCRLPPRRTTGIHTTFDYLILPKNLWERGPEVLLRCCCTSFLISNKMVGWSGATGQSDVWERLVSVSQVFGSCAHTARDHCFYDNRRERRALAICWRFECGHELRGDFSSSPASSWNPSDSNGSTWIFIECSTFILLTIWSWSHS